MKKRVKLLSTFLVMTMVLSACGAKKQDDGITNDRQKVSSISFLTKDYYGQPEVGDMLSEQFKEKTGISLEISHVPNNNWEEKITATFVSGSMPDISRLPADIYPFVKQEFLLPLDEYIEGNEQVKAIFEANPEVFKPYQFFGKTYGMSITNQKYMTVWIRTDWLDKLGIGMPTNMDEFVETLTLFRDSDLDGNGKNDTIPLTLSAVMKDQEMFADYFGTKNEIYMEDDKAVVPFITEEYKEYMDFMKSLYEQKLIDLEMPTNTSYGAVRTKFINGEAGAIIMWDDIYDTLKTGLEKGISPDAEVDYIPPFEGDKGVFGLSYYEADSPIGITAKCENPKEVFDAFFSWFLTDEDAIISTSRGVEGYHYDVVDGICVPNMENTGVTFRGQSFPPVNPEFEYPFEFDKITGKEYDSIISIVEHGKTYGDKVIPNAPAREFTSYYNIKTDLTVKITELFHNYILSNITYDEYVAKFNEYGTEIGLDSIITEINK